MAGIESDDTRGATELALAAIERLVEPGMRVLDAGCGDGPLARAAAARGAMVRAVDRDPEAIARAWSQGIPAELADIEDIEGDYDVVLANLWADELIRLAPQLASRTRCKLYVTGARLWQKTAVEQRFRELALEIERVEARDGWCGVELRRSYS
jgi:ribosomal protein L11 methyltransferase